MRKHAQLLTIITRVDRQGPWILVGGRGVLCVSGCAAPGNWSLTKCVWMIYPFEHVQYVCRCACVDEWVGGYRATPWNNSICENTCMSKDLLVRRCSRVRPCISAAASVLERWQTSSARPGVLTSLACSSWMPGRGCGFYSPVRAQFAGSHITLIFMFVALKGNFFHRCDEGRLE